MQPATCEAIATLAIDVNTIHADTVYDMKQESHRNFVSPLSSCTDQ